MSYTSECFLAALESRDFETAGHLLKEACVRVETRNKRTPIRDARQSNRVDATSESFISALESGDFTTAMSLLDEANVRAETPDKRTPLHYACQHNREDLIPELITKYNYSIEDKDMEGITPLHTAARYGHFELFKYLLMMELEPRYSCE
jgi:ankyrin repeat protein